MVFWKLNAHPLKRVTVVREGMSVGEEQLTRTTLQSDDTRIEECAAKLYSNERCELRQVYSLLHKRVFTSHHQFT